ncbi:MAG: RNA-binding cell elongation regulator Jag/EloR [Synergistaceae bacterium]|nr:RNA-binding cell elongation regulator Jag/EloR [Synergistaceae bacterium]
MTHREEQPPLPEIESVILECSSIGAARARGAEMWGITADDIEANVIAEDKKLFGILGSNLKVEIRPFAPISYIKSCYFVNEMLDRMDLDLVPELTDDGMINLVGEDVGVVIGRYGETLKALEYLTNLVCHEDMSTRRVRFDCGGYRDRRERALSRLADSVAREAVRKGGPVSLEPMSSWERRIIHVALRDSKDVETRSIGEEPSRRVIVCPRDGATSRPAPQRRRRHSY